MGRPLLLRRLQAQLPGVQPEAAIVDIHPDAAGAAQLRQRPEHLLRVEHHHYGSVGGKAAVQQVPGHIQLPVQQQEADLRIHLPHDRQDAVCLLPERQPHLVARGVAAQGVGLRDLLVPEVDEHCLVLLIQRKAVGQVVVDGAVQGDAYPLLHVPAVGAAHGAVVGHHLGVVHGVLQTHLHLLHGVLRRPLYLLPDCR